MHLFWSFFSTYIGCFYKNSSAFKLSMVLFTLGLCRRKTQWSFLTLVIVSWTPLWRVRKCSRTSFFVYVCLGDTLGTLLEVGLDIEESPAHFAEGLGVTNLARCRCCARLIQKTWTFELMLKLWSFWSVFRILSSNPCTLLTLSGVLVMTRSSVLSPLVGKLIWPVLTGSCLWLFL